MIMAAVTFFAYNVSAATTSYMTAPSLLPEGSTVTTSSYSLQGSTITAQGSHCKAYFTLHGTISVNLAAWSNRVMTIALWDEDPIFNPNDKIKVYKGTFTGREFTGITVDSVLITGDLEDTNDPTAELYLSLYITKNSQDVSGAYTGNFFQYKLENS